MIVGYLLLQLLLILNKLLFSYNDIQLLDRKFGISTLIVS